MIRWYFGFLPLLLMTWLATVAARTQFDRVIEQDERLEELNKIQEEFAAKFRHFQTLMEHEIETLKTKIENLETKVKQQDSLLQKCTSRSRKSRQLADGLSTNVSAQSKISSDPKTCWEAHVADRSLESGMYWIDPDGPGRGDGPIYVYCNMTTGTTSILHDSEGSIDTGHCFDPGCYSREIQYNGTLRQITMLIELSKECHQTIQVDCFDAALEFNNITYAWWNDRNGDPRYFWSGNYQNTSKNYHTCQCGLEGSCQDKNLSCNCDSDLAMALSDKGDITAKSLLPVTKLNFGRTIAPTSSSSHTLGRLQCTGRVVLDGMPTSCEDLWRIGHSLSGIYSVVGLSNQVDTVYCDFDKLPGDAGMETRIGFTDIKNASVHFSVGRNTSFNQPSTVLTYDYEILNTGQSMNVSSGIFTVPLSGTYFFVFFSIPEYGYNSLWFSMLVNDNQIAKCDPNIGLYPCTMFFSAQLQAGDLVQVKQVIGATNNVEFTGWLLTQDILKP